jgi:hypothetical protein
MRPLTLLRRAAYTLVGLLLALFLLVQFQQRLLRHRAERLHAEILALQLHPGTFADIQRMQKEWGRFAYHNGECTASHCIYEIGFNDPMFHLYRHLTDSTRDPAMRIIEFLGVRDSIIYADIRVHANRQWGADFTMMSLAYPGTGRNRDHPYMVSISVNSVTRLVSSHDETPLPALQQGYRTDYTRFCLGCEVSYAYVLPQTDPATIMRFNRFSFSCLTSLRGCKHPEEMAPEIPTTEYRTIDYSGTMEGEEGCQFATPVLAREANDILLVKILSLKPIVYPQTKERGQLARVQVLRPVKNGLRYRTSNQLEFAAPFFALRPPLGQKRATLSVGQEYFFLYRERGPNDPFASHYLNACHALQNTPKNAQEINEGVALDPSAGEIYDSINESGARDFMFTLLSPL